GAHRLRGAGAGRARARKARARVQRRTRPVRAGLVPTALLAGREGRGVTSVGSTELARSGGTGFAGAGAGNKRVAYYKGCLASLSAKELDTSTQALAPKVGLELIELESVTCCGAGDIHEAEPDYY